MSSKNTSGITVAGLPRIRATVRNEATGNAAGSLAAWGAVNVGAWFLLNAEPRQLLSGLPHPSAGLYVLLYGGLVLGLAMLVWAALGFLTRFSGTLWLDGLSLIAVGLWNVASGVIMTGALSGSAYTAKKPGVWWIVLGLCQAAWGVRWLPTLGRLACWRVARLSRQELGDSRKELRTFVRLADDPEQGLVAASVHVPGPLGLACLSRTVEYKGVLGSDASLWVSSGLDDCFTLTRWETRRAAFRSEGTMRVQVEHGPKVLSVAPRSLLALKAWSGQPLHAEDIQFAAEQRALTIPMLQSCLAGEDPRLRAAAVTALPTVSDRYAASLAQKYIGDPAPMVQMAALQACARLRVRTAGGRALALLRHPDQNVRASAAQYLSAVPQPSGLAALEQAMVVEETARVRKELRFAIYVQSQNKRLSVATC
jgi:hypothetical protein